MISTGVDKNFWRDHSFRNHSDTCERKTFAKASYIRADFSEARPLIAVTCAHLLTEHIKPDTRWCLEET